MVYEKMKKEWLTKKMYGIQKKLWIYMIFLVLFALLLATATVSIIAGSRARKSLIDEYGYVSDKYYNSLQSVYENLESVTANCIMNVNVQNTLKNKELSAYDREVVSRTLQFLDEGNIGSYIYIDNKDNIYTRNSNHIDIEELKQSYIYQGLGEDYSKVRLFWEQNISAFSDEMALYAGRYVRPLDRIYQPGVIYLRIDLSVFEDMTAVAADESPAYFVLDSKGEICYRQYSEEWKLSDNKKNAVETAIGTAWQSDEANDRAITCSEGVFYIRKHQGSGFSTVTFVPNKILNEMVWQIFAMIAIVFLLILVAIYLLSRFLAWQFTKPIRYISELMENFDDEHLATKAELNTNTELDDIGKSYNKMLERISDLISQVTFKERELRKAEMDTMLYQIQPHFLYNTLDTVYMLARISKEKTIMKMIQSLSTYLRINLSNGAQEIRIEEELNHVQAYMDIQKIRKSELFEYDISIEEELKDVYVLKMILQPIVENCIKHGFEDEDNDGELKIWIKVKVCEEEVVFIIENNGARIDEKSLERLNRLEKVEIHAIDSVITKSKGGFGVWNVVKRLRLRYQEQIRFYYETVEDRTCCVIKIKRGLMENHEDETN